MTLKQTFLFTALLTAFSLCHADRPELQRLDPDAVVFRYVGRFTPDFEFEWTGSSISLQIEGTSTVAAHFRTTSPVGMEIVLNGRSTLLVLDPAKTRYVVARNLPHEERHTLTLFRRSEATYGTVTFLGVEVEKDAELHRPPEKPRRLLFVGDSITCAYANETLDTNQGNTVVNQNASLSYAAIAARALDADLHMICWSGRGLYRNRMLRYEQHETMPKIFDRTLPSKTDSDWDPDRYFPDVVVINLGTNDATTRQGQKDPLSRQGYIRAYQNFLRRLRRQAPDCTLFVTLGPMGHAPINREWLEEVIAPFEDAHILIYPPFADASEIGGHWHPSVKKHHSMAVQLIDAITAATGWETKHEIPD